MLVSERIPLDEILAKYPDSVMDIEIKADGPGGGVPVAEALANPAARSFFLVYDLGTNILPLIQEAIGLLPSRLNIGAEAAAKAFDRYATRPRPRLTHEGLQQVIDVYWDAEGLKPPRGAPRISWASNPTMPN